MVYKKTSISLSTKTSFNSNGSSPVTHQKNRWMAWKRAKAQPSHPLHGPSRPALLSSAESVPLPPFSPTRPPSSPARLLPLPYAPPSLYTPSNQQEPRENRKMDWGGGEDRVELNLGVDWLFPLPFLAALAWGRPRWDDATLVSSDWGVLDGHWSSNLVVLWEESPMDFNLGFCCLTVWTL